MGINSDVQKLIVEGKITLYQLDLSNYLDNAILYFHGHTNFEKQFGNLATIESDIIWQGITYKPIPISVTGRETRADGKASSPVLKLGNYINGIQGGLSALCLQFKDLANAKLTIINTYYKYLDAANFIGGNPSAASDHTKEVWFVEQKTGETVTNISFAMSNPVDFGGQVLPSRMISKNCDWALKNRYRGQECGYLGTAYFTNKDEPTDDPSQDECSGLTSGCKLRFGEYEALPFGGFPAAGLI